MKKSPYFIDDPVMYNILKSQEDEQAKEHPSTKTFLESLAILEALKPHFKGEDGHTPSEEEIVSLFKKYAPPTERIIERTEVVKQPIVKEITKVVKEIVTTTPADEEAIVAKLESKLTKAPTAQEVINSILALKDEEATAFGKAIGSMIDISQVRNAQSFMFNGTKYKTEELMHGGGASSGGSTLATETPVGTVDDSNVTFTVTHQPLYLVVNGAQYTVGTGLYVSYLAGTITLSSPVGSGGFVVSFYQT